MTRPEFSLSTLDRFLREATSSLQALRMVYARLPQGQCRRQARCCAFLPEMTFIEALPILDQLKSGGPFWRKSLIKKIVRYYFTNPVEVSGCPFLEGKECALYAERTFGCRAYGLWPPEYYQDLVDRNSQAKAVFRQEWQKLGVSLPVEILLYRPPYCRELTLEIPPVSDEILIRTAEAVESLSRSLDPWHLFFAMDCFSDLSFFVTRWILGTEEAVRLKFLIVRDWIYKNNQERLAAVLGNLRDPLETNQENSHPSEALDSGETDRPF
jgi:hypothetical protein